uniref:NADH-ubiquinone oxidoreductase 51 kDa subunit n=1 Tax=Arundo donax TaxID=35708 RepID=A0A0A9CY81_ARUDO
MLGSSEFPASNLPSSWVLYGLQLSTCILYQGHSLPVLSMVLAFALLADHSAPRLLLHQALHSLHHLLHLQRRLTLVGSKMRIAFLPTSMVCMTLS